MFRHESDLRLSATDLSNYLGCRHRTALDHGAALERRAKPQHKDDPLLDILIQRGLEHEKRYVESLRRDGLRVADLQHIDAFERPDELVAATLAAMQQGADAIVQGALADGRWFGKPDVLLRKPKKSALGDWSYEVLDTKLARETRAGTIMQLGLYSEMLARVQQVRPELFHVVTPDPEHPEHKFRLDDYAAYFRLIRAHMVAALDLDPEELAARYYPDPVEHCEICRWAWECIRKRHADDHISLVANITRLQRRVLGAEPYSIVTVAQLAGFDMQGFKPKRGRIETYLRVREQARLQLESRDQKVPRFELRPIVETHDQGLCRLPEPSPGDIFLDLEGDPLAVEGGREYLFGIVTTDAEGTPHYRGFWGLTAKEERAAFEQVMDVIMAAWLADPDMHVYHYAPYETSALKRLMGRYASREFDIDNLLRRWKFVDLYGVVRQGLLVGTESYSIKKLEPVYGFEREADLKDANRCLRLMEQALQLSTPDALPQNVRDTIESYNRDDCVSTLRLRGWLEKVRAEAIAGGTDIPRPKEPEEEIKEPKERELRVEELRRRLLEGVLEEPDGRSDEQQARWILAYMLDYHRREDKSTWWEYFKLRGLAEEDLFDEPRAIAGLRFVDRVHENRHKKTNQPTGVVIDRYEYPAQEMEIERGTLHTREKDFGELVKLDREAQTFEVRKRMDQRDVHPQSVFEHTYFNPQVFEESLCAIAQRVLAEGGVVIGKKMQDRAGRALLLAQPPRLKKGKFGMPEGEDPAAYLVRTVLELDHSVLAVQGPPGAGKTYCGAEMIFALLEAGMKVGVAATSHKVIHLLLEEAQKRATEKGLNFKFAHKHDDEEYASSGVESIKDNGLALEAIKTGSAHVLGGTGWLWSRPEFAGAVDVLFVDEAGQMSLANVLSMSPAAKSIVLLGDPQQLEQPRKGSHPDGVGVSALEHMLRGQLTIQPEQGVFLPKTWRMCPKITRFTSELFYENRLESRPDLERQALQGAQDFSGAGLWVVRAEHDGNRTSSPEEIELIEALVRQLTSGATWTDQKGNSHGIRGSDILVVAPYNAQVSRLRDRLATLEARVGTVDKFQGQEAPVVIYSMATSRPEDAPRGMEFLYSLNRLNVATSRARCAAIVVASDFLFEPECRTPQQMKLANALCRYRELATETVLA